jgi:class III cytochrome C family protein
MKMKGKLIFLAIITAMVMLFCGVTINAEEPCTGKVADVIEMKNTEAFAKHKKSICTFTHKKHADAKTDGGYGIACGECHHDKDGKPLELTEGDTVQKCFECHNKTEKPKKPKGMAKADWKKMQLEYYYGAMHANCIDCHKKGKAGPTKCAECHPKAE